MKPRLRKLALTAHIASRFAADPTADLAPLRTPTFVLHAAGALVVLAVAMVLAVHKPRGVTGLRI